MLKAYYWLTKPGIIYGNLLNMAAGFFLAARGEFNGGLLLATLAGTSGIIGAACVFNNYIDRDIDKKMTRTKRRASVTGKISVLRGFIFGSILGLAGITILAVWTNTLTLSLGILGFAVYLTVYGWGKRHSVHGTLIGSVAGAIPPVAGYTAATNEIDAGAWLLFLILICWQMAHFYGIALYRLKDYKAAGLPVLPAVRGFEATRQHINWYILGFMVTNACLTLLNYTGFAFFIVMTITSLAWYQYSNNTDTSDHTAWGKAMFLFSLKVIIILDVALALGPLLP